MPAQTSGMNTSVVAQVWNVPYQCICGKFNPQCNSVETGFLGSNCITRAPVCSMGLSINEFIVA